MVQKKQRNKSQRSCGNYYRLRFFMIEHCDNYLVRFSDLTSLTLSYAPPGGYHKSHYQTLKFHQIHEINLQQWQQTTNYKCVLLGI